MLAHPSSNCYARGAVFKGANVAMPIVSSKRRNKDTTHRAILDEDDGLLQHKPTGEEDPLLCRNGVYFMKMHVRKRLLGNDQDLGRQGKA